MNDARAVAAEFIGSLILFATVVGSGVMAQRLAGGNDAVALIGNTAATGAVLFVLITLLGPISARISTRRSRCCSARASAGCRLSRRNCSAGSSAC